MKKFLVSICALFSVSTFAQDLPKNEVKLNILNAIAITSVELGYERFIDANQSIDAELFLNDRFSYFPQNKNKDFNATSIKVGYNYYFDLDGLTGPYVNPFIKQRFGNYKETTTTNGKEITEPYNLDSFILGIGFGYIWNYNDTFIIAPYANIGRNFSTRVNDKFWGVEPNAGVRIGYRF